MIVKGFIDLKRGRGGGSTKIAAGAGVGATLSVPTVAIVSRTDAAVLRACDSLAGST